MDICKIHFKEIDIKIDIFLDYLIKAKKLEIKNISINEKKWNRSYVLLDKIVENQ